MWGLKDLFMVGFAFLLILFVLAVPRARRRKHKEWHLVQAVIAYQAIIVGMNLVFLTTVDFLYAKGIVLDGGGQSDADRVVAVIGWAVMIGSWILAEFIIARPPGPFLAKVFGTGEPKI